MKNDRLCAAISTSASIWMMVVGIVALHREVAVISSIGFILTGYYGGFGVFYGLRSLEKDRGEPA